MKTSSMHHTWFSKDSAAGMRILKDEWQGTPAGSRIYANLEELEDGFTVNEAYFSDGKLAAIEVLAGKEALFQAVA